MQELTLVGSFFFIEVIGRTNMGQTYEMIELTSKL
jgi:hypothetical protein